MPETRSRWIVLRTDGAYDRTVRGRPIAIILLALNE